MTSPPRQEQGATLLEYVVVITLIAIIALAGIRAAGRNAANTLCKGAGYVRNDVEELYFNEELGCCGYEASGFGGFVCSD